MKLLRPLRQKCCTATRMRGGGNITPPPTQLPPPPLPPGMAPPSPPPCTVPVVLRRGDLLHGPPAQHGLQFDDRHCRMRDKVFPIRGRQRPHPGARSPAPPGTWRPTVLWGHQGGSAGKWSRGQGRGHVFQGAAAIAVVPGRICQRHRRLNAGSRGPGPAPVRGVDRQPPLPCGHDGWAVVAGPPPQASCWGRGLS
jgi:hypothetical protein